MVNPPLHSLRVASLLEYLHVGQRQRQRQHTALCCERAGSACTRCWVVCYTPHTGLQRVWASSQNQGSMAKTVVACFEELFYALAYALVQRVLQL